MYLFKSNLFFTLDLYHQYHVIHKHTFQLFVTLVFFEDTKKIKFFLSDIDNLYAYQLCVCQIASCGKRGASLK